MTMRRRTSMLPTKATSVESASPIGVMTGGNLPPRPLALVVEWTSLHQAELLENWRLARLGQPLVRIAPLE